jgi:phosphatidate cytidylyltransferase
MTNLITRSLSGFVYVGAITASILLGPVTYSVFFGLLTGLALWEFYNLIDEQLNTTMKKGISIFGGVYLFVSGFLSFAGILPFRYVSLWFLVMLFLLIRELYNKKTNPFQETAMVFFGQIYIALPLMVMGRLAYPLDNSGTYAPFLLMAFFGLIWVYDTGAYLVGITFGKHRLFERISPKKSWEGLIGGFILAIAASIGLSYLLPGHMNTLQWVGFALVTVTFGTWGDLVESMIKRSLNVKDSSNMIPGHGGLLDRIDSCLMAIPAAVMYYLFVL